MIREAQIEVIVSHCLKLNMLPNHSSVNHWQKEIALAFFKKVRKPNGNNEDMERVAK